MRHFMTNGIVGAVNVSISAGVIDTTAISDVVNSSPNVVNTVIAVFSLAVMIYDRFVKYKGAKKKKD